MPAGIKKLSIKAPNPNGPNILSPASTYPKKQPKAEPKSISPKAHVFPSANCGWLIKFNNKGKIPITKNNKAIKKHNVFGLNAC